MNVEAYCTAPPSSARCSWRSECLSSISIPIPSHSCIPSCQWAGDGITNDPSDFNANRIIVALPQ